MHDIPDSSTSVVNLIIMAFAVNEWMLYIGGLFAFLDSTSTTMFRSLISKNVRANEIGRVFSVVGVFQAVLPFITGPAFGFLYKDTVAHQPNAFLLLVIGIKVLLFIVVVIVNVGMRREANKYEKTKTNFEVIKAEEEKDKELQRKLISYEKDENNKLDMHKIAAKKLRDVTPEPHNIEKDDVNKGGGTSATYDASGMP